MASKLLRVAALFVGASASAAPPVDTTRVTGNVSAEHQPSEATPAAIAVAHPPIDTCRVSGNIVTTTTKGGDRQMCSVGGVQIPPELVQVDGDHCSADGMPTIVDGTRVCRIETPRGIWPVKLPDPADS